MDKYAIQAMEECTSDTKATRRGGVDSKPFWNINSSQFMYAPSVLFPSLVGTKEYIFTATDSKGRVHSFKSNRSTAPLTPIWKDLAPGIVELKVEAVHEVTGDVYLIGARSFCKMSPFPGREALPEKACSYKACALKAFSFVFNDETTRYWLTHGIPKPDYYHNVYPSKTISSIIKAMIAYAKIEPKNAGEALKIATNAADYLLSITYGEDSPLAGLPPTYSFKGLDKEIVDKNAPAADGRQHLLMTIYPATVGSTYLELEKATGNKKYFDAAMKIAKYYKKMSLMTEAGSCLFRQKQANLKPKTIAVTFPFLISLRSFTKEQVICAGVNWSRTTSLTWKKLIFRTTTGKDSLKTAPFLLITAIFPILMLTK